MVGRPSGGARAHTICAYTVRRMRYATAIDVAAAHCYDIMHRELAIFASLVSLWPGGR
ncbi:hypothetical protein BDZ91DRAFT_709207 [Kalaharituber pfeilii]|nr:hypothetical protein BDZ91DRAFT_709207 [Kalaharituber pfeilii]